MTTAISTDEIIAYYETAFDRLNATASKYVDSEEFDEFARYLAEQIAENPSAFLQMFQSPIDYGLDTFPLRDLLSNAVLQMQRGINATSLSKIFADPHTGLKNMPFLLEPPLLGIMPDGSGFRLLGGNHRVAAIYLMLARGGASVDEILNTDVLCRTVTVDLGLLREMMTIEDENGDTVEPEDADVLKQGMDIMFALWVSNNQSRTMQSSEITDASAYKDNVDRTPQGVRKAIRDGLLNLNQGRVYLTAYFATECANVNARLGRHDVEPNAVPVEFQVPGQVLRRQTIEAVVKSFFTALAKVKDDEGRNKYSLDLRDFEVTCDILSKVFEDAGAGTSLFEQAINQTVVELDGDTNLARQASKHGSCLAELYAGAYEPQLVPAEKSVKRKKTSKVRKLKLGV